MLKRLLTAQLAERHVCARCLRRKTHLDPDGVGDEERQGDEKPDGKQADESGQGAASRHGKSIDES